MTDQPPNPQDQPPEARIFLQPIAAPSVLGYAALCSALIIFGTWFAGAWGSGKDFTGFFEFILFFAGIGQLAAAMWSYRARDAVAASIHGAWGAFWLGFGIYWLVAATGALHPPALGATNQPVGQWFIYLSVITWTTAFAALARSPGVFVTQAVLGAAATLACAGLISGSPGWQHVAGWVFVADAGLCFYQVAAVMIDNVFGWTLLPAFSWQREANLPGGRPVRPVEAPQGEPGVKVGQ